MVERADSASLREESWLRRSEWRWRTSERSCFSRRRIPSWSFSAVEAAEPEDRAAEEKRVESKEGERKAEKVGSDAKASRGEAPPAVTVAVVGVERFWRGEAGAADDLWIAAGDAMLSLPASGFFLF